jgi:hypothetical protein
MLLVDVPSTIFLSAGIYKPFFGHEYQNFHENQPKTLVFIPHLSFQPFSAWVVLIFSSKTRELVLCDLKRAKNELKTINVSDHRLFFGQNARFQKRAFSTCFQKKMTCIKIRTQLCCQLCYKFIPRKKNRVKSELVPK